MQRASLTSRLSLNHATEHLTRGNFMAEMMLWGRDDIPKERGLRRTHPRVFPRRNQGGIVECENAGAGSPSMLQGGSQHICIKLATLRSLGTFIWRLNVRSSVVVRCQRLDTPSTVPDTQSTLPD